MEEKEIWKPIDGFPNYFVSSEGRVKSVKTLTNKRTVDRVLIPNLDATGYLTIKLYRGGSKSTHKVHRLVASAFLGESAKPVDHVNRNRRDNRVCNLRYSSYKDNRLNSSQQPREIIRLILEGTEFFQDFKSKQDASVAMGFNQHYVGHLKEKYGEELYCEGHLTASGVRVKIIRV